MFKPYVVCLSALFYNAIFDPNLALMDGKQMNIDKITLYETGVYY